MKPDDIKLWRKTHNMTQRRLAELLHVHRSDTIWTWESGKRTPPPYLYLALEALDARLALGDIENTDTFGL